VGKELPCLRIQGRAENDTHQHNGSGKNPERVPDGYAQVVAQAADFFHDGGFMGLVVHMPMQVGMRLPRFHWVAGKLMLAQSSFHPEPESPLTPPGRGPRIRRM